jgi:hypothetical protein
MTPEGKLEGVSRWRRYGAIVKWIERLLLVPFLLILYTNRSKCVVSFALMMVLVAQPTAWWVEIRLRGRSSNSALANWIERRLGGRFQRAVSASAMGAHGDSQLDSILREAIPAVLLGASAVVMLLGISLVLSCN